MIRSSVKTAFGGEVPFTNFIARDSQTQNRLLAALNFSTEDELVIRSENPTNDQKRVDLTVQNTTGDTIFVIESQDAAGWLDSIHASKIVYYMWDKQCTQGILLTEDADEYILDFVRTLNTKHNFQITVLKTIVYTLNQNEHFVDFVPVLRSLDYTTTTRELTETDLAKQSLLQTLNSKYPGLFTNVTNNYASHNRLGQHQMNVGIRPYNNGLYWLEVWHAGKHNTETFRETFTTLCQHNNLEAKFQENRARCAGGFEEQRAIEIFRLLMNALKDNTIQA